MKFCFMKNSQEVSAKVVVKIARLLDTSALA